MFRHDRFLLWILVGILLLVLVSVGLFFARQGSPSYTAADTPQGVLQNYIVALNQGDYARAFSYVAGPPGAVNADDPDKMPGLPNFEQFQQFFLVENGGQTANTGLQIGTLSNVTADYAIISVTVLRTNGGLFNSVSRESQQVQLVRQNGAWKISQGPYPFWNYGWASPMTRAKPIPAP